MIFKDFMEMYDNWNGNCVVNDSNLCPIVYGNILRIMEQRKDLYNRKIVAFGFYDGELVVRLE